MDSISRTQRNKAQLQFTEKGKQYTMREFSTASKHYCIGMQLGMQNCPAKAKIIPSEDIVTRPIGPRSFFPMWSQEFPLKILEKIIKKTPGTKSFFLNK